MASQGGFFVERMLLCTAVGLFGGRYGFAAQRGQPGAGLAAAGE
jgi:hypothetical protein